MKILEENIKHGAIKLQIETIDDLWVLYNILRENDVVYAKTTREVKVGDYSEGSRLPMILGIKVKKIEFQQFSNKLRVSGIVVEGPEKYGVKGKHHTLSLSVGDVLTIVKEQWSSIELDLLRDYTSKRENVLVVSVDHDEVCVGIVSEQGVRHVWEEELNLPSKHYDVDYESLLKTFISKVVKVVVDVTNGEDVRAVIIAGPGDLKNRIKIELVEKVKVPLYVDTVSTGGCKGVSEVLNRDVIKNIVGELNLIKARGILEEFKKLLVKEHDLVAYGIEEVYEASLVGAVLKLLVVDELLKTSDDDERNKVYESLKYSYQKGAEVIIVPGRSEIGFELDGFGGIVAILRFKLYKIQENSL
ncbi:MAG: mRNA surveillance protein pelota [Desulfurococcaceae archaeon]